MKTLGFPAEGQAWIVEQNDVSDEEEDSVVSEDSSSEMEESVEEEKAKPVAKQTIRGKYVRESTHQHQ